MKKTRELNYDRFLEETKRLEILINLYELVNMLINNPMTTEIVIQEVLDIIERTHLTSETNIYVEIE